jgi:PKD repeat protein
MQDGYLASNRDRTDDIFKITSTVIRRVSCDSLQENSYCYRLEEVNAVKFDTLPFRYEWKFGDGTKGIGPSLIHCYPGPGKYHVQLDVVNLITKEVLYNEKDLNLDIKDIEQAYISGPDEADAGQKITLSAAQTNLPGWNINRYYWNFDDGTVIVGKDVDKTFLKPGTYNVQLIVTADPEPGGPPREACVCKNIVVRKKP